MNPQLIKIKELAEEKITGGRKTTEQMLRENHHLTLSRRGNDLIPWGSSLSAGRNQTCEPMGLQLLRRDRRSTPIGRDRSLGCGFCGGGGRCGNVHRPAHRGGFGLGGALGGMLGSHGVRAVCAARERDEREEKGENLRMKGTGEVMARTLKCFIEG